MDSPFSPAAIMRASGRSMKSVSTKIADIAQTGDRPSDFGDHEPINEEAIVQVSLGKEAVPFKKLKMIDAEQWLDIADGKDSTGKE